MAVAGANRHDIKLLGPTLEAIVVERPEPSEDQPQNLSGDRGYDFNTVRAEAQQHGYVTHIRTRGEEIELKQHVPGFRCRRWVVERTHSWLNRYRRILIRWEKHVENYLGMLHLACAWICFRRSGLC